MTNQEKLLTLLQPKDYVSKIKLYCRDCKFNVQKFGQLNINSYIAKQIEIKELCK